MAAACSDVMSRKKRRADPGADEAGLIEPRLTQDSAKQGNRK